MSQVLIIGAGLSGLCLAQGLKKQGISFKVFERDSTTDARAQGYRLRLVPGAEAIHYAVSDELFKIVEQTCAPMNKSMWFKKDAISGDDLPSPFGRAGARGPVGPGKGKRPEEQVNPDGPVKQPFTVDRRVLRDVLSLGIEENIVFGKQFSHYETDDDGVTACFKDGSNERGSLLVGADGKMSRVRAQLAPEHNHLDSDGRAFYGKTLLTPEMDAILEKWNITGMHMLVDSNSFKYPFSMLLEPMRWSQETRDAMAGKVNLPQDYLYWVLISRSGSYQDSDETLQALSSHDTAKLSVDMMKHWHEDFRKILEQQDPEQSTIIFISSAHPEMPAWNTSRHVTLVGDAVHVMPPTGAAGANTALRDVERLLRKIEEVGGLDGLTVETMRGVEDELRSAAEGAIHDSFMGGVGGFGQKTLADVLADAK